MKAIKIDVNGLDEEVTDTSLKGLQEAVGGCVQAVYLRANPFTHEGKEYDIMLVDEDGYNKNLRLNEIGTFMYHVNTRANSHPIIGSVVFTTDEVWN